MKEVLVIFKEEGKFNFVVQYKVPTYRAATPGHGKKKDIRIGKVTYHNIWATFYAEAGVLVAKLTLQW